MMKSLAPLALAGVATAILWKILQILMAPVIAWIIGVLTLGLKIGIAITLLCVVIFGVRRMIRFRADNRADAGADGEAEA